MLLEDDERVYAFTRRHEDVELLVVANFSGEPARRRRARLGRRRAAARQLPPGPAALRPWEARVYKRTITPSPGASTSTSPS